MVDPALSTSLPCRVPSKPSAVLDTRVIYCGDNLDQLRKLPRLHRPYLHQPFCRTM